MGNSVNTIDSANMNDEAELDVKRTVSFPWSFRAVLVCRRALEAENMRGVWPVQSSNIYRDGALPWYLETYVMTYVRPARGLEP